MNNQFIKEIKFDEVKRIIIVAQPQYQAYLQDEKIRQQLKKFSMDTLKGDFEKLEIGKNNCRLTVKPGTEDKNMKRVEKELVKGIEMAMNYMKFMGKK